MRMMVLNFGQSMLPIFEMHVKRSSILSIVSFSGVAEVKRISRACFMSISWAKVPRFLWRSRSAFQTALAVGKCCTNLHSVRDMVSRMNACRETSLDFQV